LTEDIIKERKFPKGKSISREIIPAPLLFTDIHWNIPERMVGRINIGSGSIS
jgi:hypothetical protein